MVTFGAGLPGRDGRNLCGAGRPGVTTAGLLEPRGGDREAVSSGWPTLDSLLGGGVRRGGLIEWLAGGTEVTAVGCGTGAATLACAIACRLTAPGRTSRGAAGGNLIVVVDRAGWFHPPAILPWLDAGGPGAGRLMVARPSRDDDEIWTIEQALRCAGVAAVVAWPRLVAAWSVDRGVAVTRALSGHDGLHRWTTAMRRWQLAARSGRAVGLFVRAPAARCEPSWAESRLAVSALPGGGISERRLRIARVGGTWCGAAAECDKPVEIVLDLVRGLPVGAVRPDDVVGGGASCLAS